MDEPTRPDFTRMAVPFELPGSGEVEVRGGIEFRTTDAGPLVFDLFRPAGSLDAPRGAVVVATGYSDLGARRIFGRPFREMSPFRSWARLLAASGLVAVLHETGSDPGEDLRALVARLRARGAELGVDPARLGLFAMSGHAPNACACALAASAAPLRALAVLGGYTLDLDGATDVADAARTFRFATPAAGRSLDGWPRATALLQVRAGSDECPGLNRSTDRLFAAALALDLDAALVNVPGAGHTFYLTDGGPGTRRAVEGILGFFAERLAGEGALDLSW